MYKAYKYRIYPNEEQAILIAKTFGCCRFVYNTVLAWRKDLYEKEGKSVSFFDCGNYVNRVLKDQFPWLREPDKWALQNAAKDLDAAYKNFFEKRANYPKFKGKHSGLQAYKTNEGIAVDFEGNKIKLPKLRWVKAKVHRTFTGIIKSATVSQVPSGKYYVSILVETEHKELPHINQSVGLDLGIRNLCVASDGTKYENPKMLKKYEKKLAKLQRQLAHKEKDSNNYLKKKKEVALCHEKIANVRKDYLHKLSHKIISENQVIVTRDIQVKEMLKVHYLAKAISDASWYELTRQLEYKAAWNGRKYIKIDTFFPSSQLCSACGCKNEDVKDLSVKEWICPVCETKHDRDENAAINILNEGLRLFKEAV